jgi:DnaJ-domain-containing protein 1
MGRLLLLLVVVGCFVIGFRIVSSLFKHKAFTAAKHRRSSNAHSAQRKPEPKTQEEKHYRDVLGVSEAAGEQEIRAAYRAQLGKYHPDKVTHLGEEFHELASSRTKNIIQAYDYLKNKYGFK